MGFNIIQEKIVKDGSVTYNKLEAANEELLEATWKMAEGLEGFDAGLHPNSAIHIIPPLLLQTQATSILTSAMIEILRVLERIEKKHAQQT